MKIVNLTFPPTQLNYHKFSFWFQFCQQNVQPLRRPYARHPSCVHQPRLHQSQTATKRKIAFNRNMYIRVRICAQYTINMKQTPQQCAICTSYRWITLFFRSPLLLFALVASCVVRWCVVSCYSAQHDNLPKHCSMQSFVRKECAHLCMHRPPCARAAYNASECKSERIL